MKNTVENIPAGKRRKSNAKTSKQPFGSNCAIQVFDFEHNWHLIQPHVNHPNAQVALDRGIRGYLLTRVGNCVEAGLNPTHWLDSLSEYDSEQGPWTYGPIYQHEELDQMAEEEAERAGFKWKEVDGEISDEENERHDKFCSKFLPKPNEYRWYQLYGACHWLAPWHKEIGKLAFPKLNWKLMTGVAHSLAYATDRKGNIMLIFDILNFKRMSAMELIEFATRKEDYSKN